MSKQITKKYLRSESSPLKVWSHKYYFTRADIGNNCRKIED